MDNINIPVPPGYSGSNLAGYWHNRILAEVYSLNRKCPIFIKDFQLEVWAVALSEYL